MGIIFSDRFRKELEGKRGVTRDAVLYAIANSVTPTRKVVRSGLQLQVELGRMKNSNDYVIVWSHAEGHDLMVDSAFRISQEMVSKSPTLEPMAIFRVFTDRFGLAIPLAPNNERFYFDELIPVNSLSLSDVKARLIELTKPINQKGHLAHSNVVVQPIEKDGKFFLECMNAFSIDIDEYVQSR